MALKTVFGRIFWGSLGITALAAPVCAALCPRGRGFCPFPGKCFLYVDVDHNTLCDYTKTAVTPAPPTIAPIVHTPTLVPTISPSPVVHTTTIAPLAPAVPPAPLTTGYTGIFEYLPANPLLTGIILLVCLTALFLWVFRRDIGGIRFRTFGGRMAFSSLLGLGSAEILVCLMMGEGASGTVFALVFMVAGTVLAVYLWNTGNIEKQSSLLILTVSAVTGFVFLAPLMPIEFTGIIQLVLGSTELTPGIIGILFVLAATLFAGRVFCAYICPVGSVQELAYTLPFVKTDISRTDLLEIIRAILFIITVAAGVYYISSMEYTGIYDFFSLTLTAGFILFAIILVLSVRVYRPVCRILCPFGVIFSILVYIHPNGLGRTSACINCKKCERACPAHCAGKSASKRECYLCGRCTAACRVNGALEYGKR